MQQIQKVKRLGIYGGTFSPVHLGHLRAASAFLSECALDRLLFLPAFQSPFKEDKGDAHHRYEMLRLAIGEFGFDAQRVQVSDYEIAQGDVSYTYRTLSHFAPQCEELYFLVGTDAFLSLHRWRECRTIFELATVAVMPRVHGAEAAVAAQKQALEAQLGARILLLDAPITEISSSELRSFVAKEKFGGAYLPKSVAQYIDEHRLFRTEGQV